MAFIKHSEGEISHIIQSDADINVEKAKKDLKAAKEEAKNLDKDGNKTELNKELE